MWFKKNKWKIIVPVVIALVLAAAFYFGGDSPTSRGWTVDSSAEATAAVTSDVDASAPESDETPAVDAQSPAPDTTPEATAEPSPSPTSTAEPEAEASPSPSPTPTTAVAETAEPTATAAPSEAPAENTCTISISCATILSNTDLCSDETAALVPASGWILGTTSVTFTEGETVFDVLQRVCRENKIHLEFTTTPAYGGVYIEGIANLYEFDVGELSGWMYSVNGVFANYSCSQYELKNGDVIRWCYTCELGADL